MRLKNDIVINITESGRSGLLRELGKDFHLIVGEGRLYLIPKYSKAGLPMWEATIEKIKEGIAAREGLGSYFNVENLLI